MRETFVPFGAWLPDLPAIGNPGATEARNVVPRAASYGPMKSLNAYSSALAARCRGAVSSVDKNGANYSYAGDATKLYRLVDTAMTDASKPGGYALTAAGSWEFASWGETVIAAAIDAPTQTLTLGGTAFADLVTSTRKPKAHHLAVVREFLVKANVTDSVDGAVPYRVWWSAANDAADFDPSAATQCDYQDLLGGGGPVMKVVGGEYGVIVQRRSISRMTYEGPPAIFRFDEVERNRGAIAPGSVASLGATVFFIADDGIYAFGGSGSVPIGEGKVNKTFLADFDPAYPDRISAAIDPIRSLVGWAYPGAGNNDGTPNRILLFHWPTGRFARVEVETEILFRGIAAGYSLDGLDAASASLDALPAALDDPLWKGGALLLGAFNAQHRLAYFTGDAMEATLETAEAQLFPGARAFVRGIRPFVDGAPPGGITVQVAARDRQTEAPAWGPETPLNAATGKADLRSSGRFHRARVTISGGFSHAAGIAPDARAEGLR